MRLGLGVERVCLVAGKLDGKLAVCSFSRDIDVQDEEAWEAVFTPVFVS